jgi:hypothetical protein
VTPQGAAGRRGARLAKNWKPVFREKAREIEEARRFRRFDRIAECSKCAALALAFLVPGLSTSALAASCSHDVVAQVRLTAGKACWTYRGAATSFVGSFSSGETISAQMTGVATDYDPRSGRAAMVTRPRDPNVEGPGGYFFGVPDEPGVLTFVAPATGTYRLSFSPCAMWGAPGAVRICAR